MISSRQHLQKSRSFGFINTQYTASLLKVERHKIEVDMCAIRNKLLRKISVYET